MFENGGLSVHIIFFLFQRIWRDCILSKCQEREDQFERINFHFLKFIREEFNTYQYYHCLYGNLP